jgi:hypothetical protein
MTSVLKKIECFETRYTYQT